MKLKLLPTLSALAILAVTAVSYQSLAQPAGGLGFMPPPMFSELNLTAEQQAQLEQIRVNTIEQIKPLLTTEQQQQLPALEAQMEAVRQSIAQLNLTAEQRQQIHEIMRSTRPEVEAVLTSEQRQQLRSRMQEMRPDMRPDR
jgi:Spy/CpxP family protein refolding chaperone